ncbi:MAG TPA: replication initiation protein [Gammaproteobacteria bacterium]|nr:replication initiation protein [Gammaproteobacteria bacterium]
MGFDVTDRGLEKTSAEHELKKHAATIHCSNALSLLQRKISNALLYHAYKELLLKEEHEITIKQLCQLITYNGNNHAAIKDALKGLLSTVIEWNVVSDTTGAEDWTASSILASVSLKGPNCSYAYSPRMKQLLHSPSMFGKINLFIQSRFKSSYGLALYENCIRYRGLPFTKWFEMDVFRKLMGVPSDKYIVFRDFKRRVLDKSIEEVNTYSELVLDPEFVREGRQIVKIRFVLKERPKKTRLGHPLQQEEPDETVDPLRSKLMTQFDLSVEQLDKILQDYSREFIAEKVILIESSNSYQMGKVQNCAAYFLSALKNNYQPAKISRAPAKQKRETDKEEKSLIVEVESAYLTYREEAIDAAIAELDEEEKTRFRAQFSEHAAKTIKTILKLQRQKYTAETVLNSPQIKALLRQFALQVFPSLRTRLISLEKFLEGFSERHRQAFSKRKEMEAAL